MRVLHIIESANGGSGRHTIGLVNGLVQRGIEVHLAYSPLRMDDLFASGLERLSNAGVTTIAIPLRRSPHPSDLANLATLYSYVKKNRFQLLHGQSSKGGAVARILGACTGSKTVYTPHAFITLNPESRPITKTLYSSIERLLRFWTNSLIVVSEFEATEAKRLGFSHTQIHLVPNGISLGNAPNFIQTREGIRKTWELPPDALVIGFVGRFAEQKAPQILLKAFAQMASTDLPILLVMVGDGSMKPILTQLAHHLGIADRVKWPGFVDGWSAMAGFDIFALPSIYEGFPYVLLEAMSSGLPIVTTSVGGTEMTVINDQNGLVVPVGDVEAFAHGLTALATQPELRRKFSIANAKRIKDFTEEHMVEQTIGVYHTLVS